MWSLTSTREEEGKRSTGSVGNDEAARPSASNVSRVAKLATGMDAGRRRNPTYSHRGSRYSPVRSCQPESFFKMLLIIDYEGQSYVGTLLMESHGAASTARILTANLKRPIKDIGDLDISEML